jgi:hypothetical protein
VEKGRRARGLIAAAAVLMLSAVALLIPAHSPLYADVYPGLKGVHQALADAELVKKFTPAEPMQFRETTFRATLLYGKEPQGPSSGPIVKVGWANEALLEYSHKDFDIHSIGDSIIYLDRGGKRQADGRYALSWTWALRPLRAGTLHLSLKVIPYATLTRPGPSVNRAIDITVQVSPVQSALDDVVAQARHNLDVAIPDRLTVGKATTVTAALPLGDHGKDVSATLSLTRASDSSGVTIQPKGSATAAGGEVHRAWVVTPTEQGSVALVMRSRISAMAGETVLQRDVTRSVSRVADQSFVSWFFNTLIGRVAAVLGLIGGIIALFERKRIREALGNLRRRFTGSGPTPHPE